MLDRVEPSSHALYARLAVVPSRTCGRHPLVLQQTTTLIERALALAPNNPAYLTELGIQLLLQENVSVWMRLYVHSSVFACGLSHLLCTSVVFHLCVLEYLSCDQGAWLMCLFPTLYC